MPDLIPKELGKEINVAGREIPLYVPVVGAGIAVLLVVVVKLRGGGRAAPAETPTQAGPSLTGVPTIEQFQSAIGELQGGLAAIQGNIAEQIAGVQGQITAAQAAQAGFAEQLAGYQAALGEQGTALAAGISGVTQQMQAYQSDVNTRLTAVEGQVNTLRQTVQQQAQDLTPQQKVKVAYAFRNFTYSIINWISRQANVPTWDIRINPQTGATEGKPSTTEGYWQPVFWS